MKDLFDIAERSQPGERQTDIELIIEEKTMTTADYVYKRKDGGETWCYGTDHNCANYAVVCDDESYDGIATDIVATTWHQVCKHLEANYNNKVEQVEIV